MRATILIGVGLVALAGLGGCATQEQWAEISKHPSWFASWEHLRFSARNQGEKAVAAPRVSREDLRLAQAQGWWGDALVVRPDQIFSN